MSVHLVVQRYRSCKLLVNESEWVAVPPSKQQPHHQHCGLLVYVSLAATANPKSVCTACDAILNLPVLTTGLWGDGVSEQLSVRQLLQRHQRRDDEIVSETTPSTTAVTTSITIVPQANLISKIKSQGKSIQYHGQIDKTKGQELYDLFIDCIRAAVYEEQQCNTNLPAWYATWKLQRLSVEDDEPSAAIDASVPPLELFRNDPKYHDFDDETGLPRTTIDGEALTKSAIKKLRKLQDAHAKRHAKWKERNFTDVATAQQQDDRLVVAEPTNGTATVHDVDWEKILDPNFCCVVAGSFGKRQGLELESDMGPFCHVLQI